MKRIFITLVFGGFFYSLHGAPLEKSYPRDVLKNIASLVSSFSAKTEKDVPFKKIRIDIEQLRAQLQGTAKPSSYLRQSVEIQLPHLDGTVHTYRAFRNHTIPSDMAEKFPELRTYDGQGISNPTEFVKFDINPFGLHAMIMTPGRNNIFIMPVSDNSRSEYKIYTDEAMQLRDRGICNTLDTESKQFPSKVSYSTSCQLRTFSLALASPTAYTQTHGGTASNVYMHQATTVNFINAVYERDLNISLTLVPGSTIQNPLAYPFPLIFGDPANPTPIPDPFSPSGDLSLLAIENQQYFSDYIDPGTYDLAQVYFYSLNTIPRGETLYLGEVCSDLIKAGAASITTSLDDGDIYAIAHEMGHQFGATHTQNNQCQRAAGASVETGGGVTLMSYGGAYGCPPSPTIAVYDYFHAQSIQQISAFLSSAQGMSCGSTTSGGNIPIINSTNGNAVFPVNTPFSLVADVTPGASGDNLLFNWEQMNTEVTHQPPVNSAVNGPNFRNFLPGDIPFRYFPNLDSLSQGGPFTWEALPSVSRTLNFRLTVEEQNTSGTVPYCSAFTDVTVTTDAASGPFLLTYPNQAGITWARGSTQQVTWNVANTNNVPVSAPLVDVLLSVDGGLTFPYSLATAAPNSGAVTITVPNINSSMARILVRSSDQRFFTVPGKILKIT